MIGSYREFLHRLCLQINTDNISMVSWKILPRFKVTEKQWMVVLTRTSKWHVLGLCLTTKQPCHNPIADLFITCSKYFAWSERSIESELCVSQVSLCVSHKVFYQLQLKCFFLLFFSSRSFYMDTALKFEPWIFADLKAEKFYTVADSFILDFTLFYLWTIAVDNDFQKANDSLLFWQWEDKQLRRGGQRF